MPEESPKASETVFLPPLSPLAELSTPAAVTEGRTPAENLELPKSIFLNPILDDSFPVLVSELPENEAAFYALSQNTVLIRWGDSRAEFDWPWLTPQQVLPLLFCLDADGDQEDESLSSATLVPAPEFPLTTCTFWRRIPTGL